MRKPVYSILCVFLLLLFVWSRAVISDRAAGSEAADAGSVSDNTAARENAAETSFGKKTFLRLWYTDAEMTEYLQKQADRYMAAHPEIYVLPELVNQEGYAERIYEASIGDGADQPDLFLTTNDTLEKAYLSGIAAPIPDGEALMTEADYPDAARSAVSCRGKIVAYPFYYDTAIFLYNSTYLEQMAKAHNEAAADQAEGEAAEERTKELLEAGLDPEEIEVAMEESDASVKEVTPQELIPRNFEDILNLANDYDAPEGMESILKWDVTDVLYNYFFAGNYMQIGGECGDDKSLIDICNPQSVASLEVYQALRPFFSIEEGESDYDTILKEFAQGKVLFTIASTDALSRLDQEKKAGRFTGQYGVSFLPDLNDQLSARGLSITTVIAVNGFRDNQKEANDLAAFLACECDSSLFTQTGHLAASRKVEYEDDRTGYCMAAYEKSIGLPKIMEASNFWMQLEITLTGIWEGDDIDSSMQKLEDQIRSQL